MSWVPSPSGRLTASYREVSVPTVLGSTQRGPSLATGVTKPYQAPSASSVSSTVTTHISVAAPAAASGSPTQGYLAPGPLPRQQTAYRSPGATAATAIGSPVGRAAAPAGFSMPSTQSIGSTAFATSIPAAQAPFPPMVGSMAGLPFSTPIGPPNVDELSRSLTMLPFSMPGFSSSAGADLLGSPAGSPQHRDVSTSSTSGPPPPDPPPRKFKHKRSPSYTEVPGPVCVNIYWQRPVAFDDKGRAQRRLGGGDLTWGKKFLKDVIGVYHVGVEVYGQEYTFGNYHAPGSRQVGGERSGVFAHEPRRPGPHCAFKQAEKLGKTSCHPSEVEEICIAFGNNEWGKVSYNKIHHNCVDFAKALCLRLDVEEIPAWCYRGAAIGKLLGIGGPEPEDQTEQDVDGVQDMSGETNGSLGTMHDDMDTRIGHHRLADANRLAGSFAGPVGHDSMRAHSNSMSMSSTAPTAPTDGRNDSKPTNTSVTTTTVTTTMVVANGVVTNGPSYVAPPMDAVAGARGPSYVAPPVDAVQGARGPSYVAPPIAVTQNRGPSYVAPPIDAGTRGPSYVAPPTRGPSYVAPPIDAVAANAAAMAAAAAAATASGNTATGTGARGASFVSPPMTLPSSTYVSPPSYVAPPGRPSSHIAPQVAGGSAAVMTGAAVHSATMPSMMQSVTHTVPQGAPQGAPPNMAQAATMRSPVPQAAAPQMGTQPPAVKRSSSEDKGLPLSASRRVTVLQSNGTWATGKIVCQDYEDKYTILYDANWSTEVNVPVNRIVALPEDSKQGPSQGPRANDGLKLQGFQGLASADSILQPLQAKQAVNGNCRTNGSFHRDQQFPHFAAPAGTSTTGGFQTRSTLAVPASTTTAPFRFTATTPMQAATALPAMSTVPYTGYTGNTHYSGRGKDLGATWR